MNATEETRKKGFGVLIITAVGYSNLKLFIACLFITISDDG
jgi:hypothetical protein